MKKVVEPAAAISTALSFDVNLNVASNQSTRRRKLYTLQQAAGDSKRCVTTTTACCNYLLVPMHGSTQSDQNAWQ
jgi:hypothetical protein